MKLLIKKNNLEFLSTQFENIQFHMFRSDDNFSFITCLACICERSNDIVEHWKSIQNMLAVFHQGSGDFDAWNVYLAFISVENVPTWAKYEIENNKFSARKIILDGFQEVPSLEKLTSELENQLLGSDLTLESRSGQLEEHLINSEYYYRGAPIDSKHESREKRALIIDNIIKRLNNNEN